MLRTVRVCVCVCGCVCVSVCLCVCKHMCFVSRLVETPRKEWKEVLIKDKPVAQKQKHYFYKLPPLSRAPYLYVPHPPQSYNTDTSCPAALTWASSLAWPYHVPASPSFLPWGQTFFRRPTVHLLA